jgi:hypothetical protein
MVFLLDVFDITVIVFPLNKVSLTVFCFEILSVI